MKAVEWLRAGWRFASRPQNVQPFYLLNAGFFLLAGLASLSVFSSVLEGPAALLAVIKDLAWAVPLALLFVLAFFAAHSWLALATYYRFAKKRSVFRKALRVLPGALAAALFIAMVRAAFESTAEHGFWWGVTGTALSAFASLALLFVIPSYAFRRGLLKAFKESWELFSREALEVLAFALGSAVAGACVLVAGVVAAVLTALLGLVWPPLFLVSLPLALVLLSYFAGFAQAFGAGATAAAYLNLSRKSFRGRRRA